MNSVGIQTTQNIALHYPLAGVGPRIGAYLIDSLIVIAVYFLAILLLTQGGMTGLWLIIPVVILSWLYFLLCEVFMNGQTVGKKALDIKVVKLDGSRPSVGAFILRWIMIPIDFGIMSGAVALISIVATRHGQRLGDLLAGTTVVKLKVGSIHALQKKRTLVSIEEDYIPTYPQAADITDEEVRLMQQALAAFNRNGTRGPMENLRKKIQDKYRIETEDLPIRFLTTLQKDHAYFERERSMHTLEE